MFCINIEILPFFELETFYYVSKNKEYTIVKCSLNGTILNLNPDQEQTLIDEIKYIKSNEVSENDISHSEN